VALRISVWDSKELQATLLAIRGLEPEMAKQLRRVTKAEVLPMWREAVRGQVTNRMETRVLSDTARVAVSNQNVMLQSARVGRSLSGGYKPSELMGPTEFGADRGFTRGHSGTSPKGTQYTVKRRHTQRQFRPRNKKGYVVYQAAAEVIPRIASLWIQTAVRTVHEQLEKAHG
jgi:hypothetical protein